MKKHDKINVSIAQCYLIYTDLQEGRSMKKLYLILFDFYTSITLNVVTMQGYTVVPTTFLENVFEAIFLEVLQNGL